VYIVNDFCDLRVDNIPTDILRCYIFIRYCVHFDIAVLLLYFVMLKSV